MKINCGPSPATKRARAEVVARGEKERLLAWHAHFAWWPVRVGEGDCRWLEVVERKFQDVRIRDFGGDGLVVRPFYPLYRPKDAE